METQHDEQYLDFQDGSYKNLWLNYSWKYIQI